MYGPVCTVVWQGSAGDRRPYADQVSLIIKRTATSGYCLRKDALHVSGPSWTGRGSVEVVMHSRVEI